MTKLLKGVVVHGDKLGRKLGYPTANLNWPKKKRVAKGVYATEVQVLKKNYQGVAVIGIPSVLENKPKIEIHILDFNKMIYGKWLYVRMVKKIRNLKQYKTKPELKKAINKDCQKTRQILTSKNK